ncbi:GLYCINE-RICH CELL WALL STRUCTURAL PROTEIN 1.8-LIKE [Salix viminalis]|uniref:GLYCINE-RICH CELL WALL STRUCTURAL PROTEIN 1.8-LIKE n=1 Tax=Salix viminalis TaxID=40686 RepID=A0A9Q0NNE0_SALVM|nr:GLYCINE-RICH CELL WALL STRUCTURAL PROTEIN 1.8-LIKE [Salix viminalis]
MTTANGFWLFRFKTEDQMLAVLERGPWMFGGKTMILQQWSPCFIFDKNRISKLPVWIRFHGLPFSLWSRKGLSVVASRVGRPLSCDEQTYCCTRLDYARVCVEVDASQPFVTQFDINTPFSDEPLHLTVEYEWIPPRCDKCKVFGHNCS